MEITKAEIAKIGKPRGRPLSFNRAQALEQAMHVFWQRGYEAASISELTAAMGITAPSLYTAFGGLCFAPMIAKMFSGSTSTTVVAQSSSTEITQEKK